MRITKATNINASTADVLEPTVDNVLNLIENKKIIFKNDVAYWSKGKSVLPKEYRDCIEQTQYAHWINEWSCEQAEKLGDRAYYDYDGDTEVKATNMRISKSTKTDVKASKSFETIGLEPRQRTARDGKTYWVVFDTEEQKYSTLTQFGKYASKKDCQYAIDKYKSQLSRTLGRDFADTDDVDACGDIKASTSTDKALKHIKAAIDILGKSGDKTDITKDSIANLAVVMFDLQDNK